MRTKPKVCAAKRDTLPEGISLCFVLFITISISKSTRLFNTLDPATETRTMIDPMPNCQIWIWLKFEPPALANIDKINNEKMARVTLGFVSLQKSDNDANIIPSISEFLNLFEYRFIEVCV